MNKFYYWEVTAQTGYCGEELSEYCITTTDEPPRAFGDDLMAEVAAQWAPDFETDYEDYGYESPEDYEESFYADCDVTYRSITKEEYESYTCGLKE